MAEKYKDKIFEILRFGLVGGIATALHYGVYLLLLQLSTLNATILYSVGYGVSLIVNFYLTAFFTFKEKVSVKRGSGFLFSHVINYLLHIFLLNIFISLGLSKELAPIGVFAIAVPINFLLVRFVFKSKMFGDE